jgi:hypothetical protein
MKRKLRSGSRRAISTAKVVRADDCKRQDLKEVVQQIRELRKGAALGKIKIPELIDEGRRY